MEKKKKDFIIDKTLSVMPFGAFLTGATYTNVNSYKIVLAICVFVIYASLAVYFTNKFYNAKIK